MTPQLRSIAVASSAVDDLRTLREWYVGQQATEAGERLLRELVERIARLAEYPEMGRIVPEFGAPHLREIVHPPFRIVYRLDADSVQVVRVWRTERRLELPTPDE